MPRQTAFQLENNFTKGLVTEATGLNFPENACTETYDCVFSEKGRVSRRLGFDYESGAELDAVTTASSAIYEYVWNSAGSTGDADIVVVQIGATLHYYAADDNASLSGGKFGFTTNLLTYKVSGNSDADVKATACQFASGNGYLFVVNPYCEPIYISFNPSVPSVTATQITIKARDFEGDKTDANYNNIDTRPSTLSDAHKYNLYNQGWYQAVRLDGGGGPTNPVTDWDSARTDFPSNADIWWMFKNASEEFDDGWIDRFVQGNTPAPKGHYILNDFSTNRTSLSGITATERNSGGKRPSTVAFFTSRVWYSGVTAQEYNQKIYFSQIIENTEQFGKCYQANDPTSEETSDLLPSDGGVISIPDVGKVLKLFPMANSLIVFGTNGVWAIGGSEGVGFKTTDYAIRKISSVETISALNFVDVYGTPMWWNTDGIFSIQSSELSGLEVAQSISDETIKDFLLNIPSSEKFFVKGAFNSRSRIVQWIYRSTIGTTIDEHYQYDRILNYNLLSKAFYPWTISTSETSPRIQGIIVSRGATTQATEVPVVDSNDEPLVDINGDPVVVLTFTDIEASVSFRYLTTFDGDATWSQNNDDSYLDWVTEDEDLDYLSYLFTGYKVHGDAIRFFENNYLTVTMTSEDNSSAFVQGVWDYSNSPSSARFTNPQQVYINKIFRDAQQTRKKIRGRGRSLHFKFYSETGKPFDIHGWSSWETQNASV